MANERIDWGAILAQLVAAALPIIIKMILDWLQGVSDEQAVVAGKRAGMFYNAARKEVV